MVSGSCLCEPSLVPAFIVALSKRGGSRSYLEAGARGRPRRQLRRSPKSTTTNATAKICRLPLRDWSTAPDRLQPFAPAHPVALAIKEWVDAEALLDQSRPAQAPRKALIGIAKGVSGGHCGVAENGGAGDVPRQTRAWVRWSDYQSGCGMLTEGLDKLSGYYPISINITVHIIPYEMFSPVENG